MAKRKTAGKETAPEVIFLLLLLLLPPSELTVQKRFTLDELGTSRGAPESAAQSAQSAAQSAPRALKARVEGARAAPPQARGAGAPPYGHYAVARNGEEPHELTAQQRVRGGEGDAAAGGGEARGAPRDLLRPYRASLPALPAARAGGVGSCRASVATGSPNAFESC